MNDLYNIKVIHYATGDQVRIYKNPVAGKNFKYCDDDGVIIENELKEVMQEEEKEYSLNPFTGNLDEVNEWDVETEKKSKERSKEVSMARTVNKIYSLSRSNKWEYFFTLKKLVKILTSKKE